MGTLTIRLKPENREKLVSMANECGVTPNRMVNLLIENAVFTDVLVTREVMREPVAQVEKKGVGHDRNNNTQG